MAGFYIHIPFCKRKCAYCDFVSYPDIDYMGAYLDALKQEIVLTAGSYPCEKIDTVFIGGGTPSLLPGEEIADILRTVERFYDLSACSEVTMECNPGTTTAARLQAYHDCGVNRLSIGLQSADDALLKRIGRIHSRDAFFTSYQDAVKAGFRNINVDCMHGLPGQDTETYLSTLRFVSGLAYVTHISSYSLILEEGTPLYRMVEQGRESLPDEDLVADMQDEGMLFLESQGFLRYEVSNFAKEGFACQHNLNYWRNGSYIGVGCAAHSAQRISGNWTRRNNVEDLHEYLDFLAAGKLPVLQSENISQKEEMFECVMLGLRTVQGLDLQSFYTRFGTSVEKVYAEQVKKYLNTGLMRNNDNTIALTKAGMDVENEILLSFME